MKKAIKLKAQKRYENPVYKKLKKFEDYVTEKYVYHNFGYDKVISIKTNGRFFDSEHRRIGIIVDLLSKYCDMDAQYISIGDETVLGVGTNLKRRDFYSVVQSYRLSKKQQELLYFIEDTERKDLSLGCLLIERFAKLMDERASVEVRVFDEEYLYGRFAVLISDFEFSIRPDMELDKPADDIPVKIEKKVDAFVDLVYSKENASNRNVEAAKLKQKILAYGFDLIWHYPGEDEVNQPVKRRNFYDIEGQPKQPLRLGEYGEIALRERKIETEESDELPVIEKSGNAFSEMGKGYHSWLSFRDEEYIADAPYNLLSKLNRLSLDESQLSTLTPTVPYSVGTVYPKMGGMGDNTGFRLYQESETNEKALLRYIILEMSEQGVWQLYLLMTTPCVMPAYWHGEYLKRMFIFEKYDLYGIEALEDYDLTDLEACPLIWPSVSLERQTEDAVVAHVFCCYWNDWKGLIREHVKVTLKNGRVEKYENLDDYVIYKYHCGIFQ